MSFQIDECIPTALLPSSKKPLFYDNDDCSTPSETCSRTNSLTDLQEDQFCDEYPKYLNTDSDEEENSWNRIYENVEMFLDSEGLFIVTPKPNMKDLQIKSPQIVLCASKRFSIDVDSEESSSQAPVFLVRRKACAGLSTSKFILTSEEDL